MKKIKTLFSFLIGFMMVLSLAGCGSSKLNEKPGLQTTQAQNTSAETVTTEQAQDTAAETVTAAEPESEPADGSLASEETSGTEADTDSAEENNTSEDVPAGSDVLVAYFSATGTTKGVAEKIAAVTGGDLYEILAAEPYTADDLNYSDRNSRSTKEQNDKSVRPEIGSEDISLEGYTTVYLGFPIWWGEEPRILDTFVEKYSFEGITVIPFCTSSSSGIGHSGPNMEALAGSGTWLQGKRFGGNVSEADLQSWIDGLK